VVNVLALDDVLDGERVSFIKMKHRGCGARALRGAAFDYPPLFAKNSP